MTVLDKLGQVLSTWAVDDTPVDGETDKPISSNWAFDHVAAADPHTGYLLESLLDAHSIVMAVSDNTPVVLAVAASRFVGRKASGNIAAMTGAEAMAVLSGQAAAEFLFNTQKVGDVVDPTTDQQVATKKYVDIQKNWLPGWDKRIKLTIDNTDIDGALTDFPILVYLSASSGRNSDDVSAVFDELTADGNRKKIAITTSDGITECYVEIERWDDANEKAWLWIKVPSIASGADTDLYLYYDADHADNTDYVGDTSSTPAENVWDANFKAVYHMRDGVDNANIYDSTGNNNDGTKKGANEPIEASGLIDKAQDFDGADDRITLPVNTFSEALFATGITLEACVKFDTFDNTRQQVIDIEGRLNIAVSGTIDEAIFSTYDGASHGVDADDKGALSTGTWYLITGTWDTTDLRIYIDAVADATTAASNVPLIDPVSRLTTLGANYASGEFLDGLIDEVRISNIARTPAWIKATKESLWDDLLAFGGEEIWAFHHAAFHGAGGDDELSLVGLSAGSSAFGSIVLSTGAGKTVDEIITELQNLGLVTQT